MFRLIGCRLQNEPRALESFAGRRATVVASGCGVGHEIQPLLVQSEGCRPPRRLAVVRHGVVESGESRALLRGWLNVWLDGACT